MVLEVEGMWCLWRLCGARGGGYVVLEVEGMWCLWRWRVCGAGGGGYVEVGVCGGGGYVVMMVWVLMVDVG